MLASLLALGILVMPSAQAFAKVFYSQKEALELAFPDADRIDRRSVALDDDEAQAIEARAKSKLESRIVTLFTGLRGDDVLGYAFIDVHNVRTLPEAFLIVLKPDGSVHSLRLLAFYEPQEYKPSERWLRQFDDRHLDKTLRLGGEIHGIAGSTLSSHAVTGGVRRALALYELLVLGSTQAEGRQIGQTAPAKQRDAAEASAVPVLGSGG
ncbi:MAG: FMN-binding protein [Myxococcota bacterium]|nr:FMN-binding protein [Myxococcota bacterium]